MAGSVQVAWLTGTEELNRRFAAHVAALHPALPLVAVSEFPPEAARWIPYHPKRSFRENLRSIGEALRGQRVKAASVVFAPRLPFWRLRVIALILTGGRLAVYDHDLICRPWPGQLRRLARSWLSWHMRSTSPIRRWLSRVRKPREALKPIYAKLAQFTGRLRRNGTPHRRSAVDANRLAEGIAVVIPSRNGLPLLRECLPRIAAECPAQIIVVDNGSDDGTQEALRADWPSAEVVSHAEALPFSRAINLGLERVRHKRVLLLNNDMLVEAPFLSVLDQTFGTIPDLFCATAQILFPPGVRREETGKAVLRELAEPTEFPVRCEVPLPGEDCTSVLYGSGGCSLFDTQKVRLLGGLNEMLTPAYCEDLDIGFRAWQRGWPTVFRSGALAEHRHRSTTARYWSTEEIRTMVEVNYLRFLASAVKSAPLFTRLWDQAVRRLHLNGAEAALRRAVAIPLTHCATDDEVADEESTLALTNGDVAVFPGRPRSGKPVVVIASPYLPFPLAHGGAVRIYNLMLQGLEEVDWVLIAFAEQWQPPPAELLALACEVILVRRRGSHYKVTSTRPDTVEEFDSASFHAVLQQTVRNWRPIAVQLEWTQMAQYAPDCFHSPAILVEHDLTLDLFEQLAASDPANRDVRMQLERWCRFETAAWDSVDAVVTMSEKDRRQIGSAKAIAIPNGVDTDHYRPCDEPDDGRTILFIGSFAHHPNRSAVDWFLSEVWPLLEDLAPELHIIAGAQQTLTLPRVRVEGFVKDVRPAYREAAVVIAPLVVSAGTNIKILEAMAMGKAVVSTPAGVNGLEIEGVTVAEHPAAFAAAVRALLKDPEKRRELGSVARRSVEKRYSWQSISGLQSSLYRELSATKGRGAMRVVRMV